jgi:hypothetical protein
MMQGQQGKGKKKQENRAEPARIKRKARKEVRDEGRREVGGRWEGGRKEVGGR